MKQTRGTSKMTGSPNLKSQELSPAMMRLPPSPDTNAMTGQMLVPEFLLDDDTIMHRGNLSKNLAAGGTVNATGNHHHIHQQPQPQHRLRSVAKYNAFYPQALACSNDILTTSYKDHLESYLDFGGPASLGAIAGPRGVALFRLSRPHIPLLIFSHATNYSSSARKNNKTLNSISSLAFQPTNGNSSSTNSNTLYLAAARGSGVLIWDASGHSPNPLLGRLLNDTTNDTTIISGVGGRRDLETRITSMSWMSYCNRNSSSNSPLLATTTASSLSMWDLRSHQASGLFKPSLRFGSSRNASVAATSSLTPAAPLVQVACSSCSEECATMDVSGIVRTYDLRKTDGGGRSSVGYPLSVFMAHEAGVGIDHLPRSHDGRVESAWVTWGLEAHMPSAIIKVWGMTKSSACYDDSSDPAANVDEKEEYWFMGDESQKTPSTKCGTQNNNNNDLSTSSADYQLIAQFARSNMCCARVCAAPVNNSLVVVGYLDDKLSQFSNETTGGNSGWWAELMTLSSNSTAYHELEANALSRKQRGEFGLDRIVSFSGGAANTDVDKKSLTSVLGNSNVGRLQAAELAFSSLIIPRNGTGGTTKDGSNRNEKDDETVVELLLCCLSDTGVLTTTAIPEALPTTQEGESQRRDTSPQRSLNRGNIIRTAFASSNNQARVFPETKEGNSLIDVASMWGASANTTADLVMGRGDDKRIKQSRSSSPLKVSVTTEDSLRNNGRRQEGGFMPFDMDVPVPVAYNSVTAGNLNGIQLGITEMTPLSAIRNSTEDGIENELNSTSIIENIDTERVPCPRLCGAVFGSGNGRLTIFRNGEVKKMWNWYQKTDTIRLSSIPGGQVDVASSSNPQTHITDTKISTDSGKRYQMASSSGPRTLKELVDMVSAAKEAQWGEANDVSGAEDTMSVLNNFFDDDSLESNSDDSGNDDEDEDDELMEDTDEIYKRYFGGRSWKGFSEIRTSMAQTQSIESSRSMLHRSIGPSSDMLQPVVTVNVVVIENQNILLAKGWKLGRWENGDVHIDTDLDLKSENSVQRQLRLLNNQDKTPKKGSSSFSRTMSVPDLSRVSEINRPMDDPSFRENMEESMTFLKKLFSHQQEGDITFPTTLLSPPDSKILMNQRYFKPNKMGALYRPGDPFSGRHKLDAVKVGTSDSGVHTLRIQRHDRKSIYLDELEEIHQLCLHNAEISKDCNEMEKESVWNLLAETALTQMNLDGKMFNGWGGKGGGALGIDLVNNFFLYYEALGDVQMLATMFCVLNGRYSRDQSTSRPSLLPSGREEVHDTYIIRYAELLYSWGLLNTRVELNKHLHRKDEQNEFQFQSTEDGKDESFDLGVTMSCPTCENEVNSRTNYCRNCKDFAFRCSICDTAVRGLFTFCEMCKHGGHLSHMVNWFSKNSYCPTGCGCQCRFSPKLHSKTEIGNQEIF